MRIVAGNFRGRRLVAPPGGVTRPTSDRARQALFDVLAHAPFVAREALSGARVLDAFAGTGALGLEALSRGAAEAWFMERDRAALVALGANIAGCRVDGRAHVIAGDALAPPRAAASASLAFLDPPYRLGLVPRALTALGERGWLMPGTLVVAEIDAAEEIPRIDGGTLLEARRWGAARVLFIRMT